MSTAAPVFVVRIPQFSDYRRTARLRNKETGDYLDLTDYTIELQIRESFAATETIISISSDGPTPDGQITIDGDSAEILIPADVTAELDFDDAVYDVRFITYEGEVIRVVQGRAVLDRGVTR